MNEHTKMDLERKKKKEKKTENQDTTSTSRIVTRPTTPHLKKRWLHKARNSIGIVTPLSIVAIGSGSEVATNTTVCSKEGVSSEKMKNEHMI